VQFASGAIAAGCHHNGCHGNNWHALRDLYEPGWQTRPRAATFHVSSNGHGTPPSATPILSITSGQAQPPGIAPAHGQQAALDAVEVAQQAAEALLHTLPTLADDAKEDAILDALPALAPLDTIAWMRLKRQLKAAVPSLNLNDVERARSELRRASAPQATAPAGSAQAQIAAALAQQYAGQLAYETSRKAWMTYAHGLWTPTDTEYIQQRIASYMDALLHGDYSWYELSGVEHLLGRRLAQTLTLEIPGWLPFRNGALHLETMTLHAHSPDRPFTWQLPHHYAPQATCPKTQAWLHETVGGAHDQVQVLRAYARAVVTRRVDLQRYLETIGPGGTGKGTYTRLLQGLVGSENTFATELKHLEANRFELSNLRGKVLLMITDAERYSGPINALKAITGQDFVRMEEKFKPQRTEIAPVMVVVAANEPIQSADYTSGLERRRLSMYFRHRPTTPRDLLSWKDAAWHGELAPEIPGILNWVLALPDAQMEGLLQQATALVPSLKTTWAYALVDTNPLAEWANQTLILDNSQDAQGKALAVVNVGRAHKLDRSNDYEHQDIWLYPNYRAWVDDTGGKPLSSRRFTGLLKDLFENQLRLEGVEHTDDMHGSRFHGIRFRRASDTDEPLLITKNPPPMTDMTGSMTAETRANDGYDACDAFLHSLYRHLPTPCTSVGPSREGRCSIDDNAHNPSYLSYPSSVRSADVIGTSYPSSVRENDAATTPAPVTEPLSEGCPVVGECPRCGADRVSLVQRQGQPACLGCSLLSDDELARMHPPMPANGTPSPDTGLPLKGQAPAQTVKATRQRRTVNRLPTAGACPTPGCPGRLKTTGKGASAAVFCVTCKYRGYVRTDPPASAADEVGEVVI
jgi:phage/plasmid-associated DNA primase